MSSTSSTHNDIIPCTNSESDRDLNPTLEKVREAINKNSGAYKDCPECGISVDKKQRTCHDCSYNFFTRKKKKVRRTNPYSVSRIKSLKDRRQENIGGFKRRSFFTANILNIAFCAFALFALWGSALFQVMQNPSQMEKENIATGTVVISLLILFTCFVAKLIFTALRLKNLGSSKWQTLLIFLPIINIWLSYRLYVCPQAYAEHKTLDTKAKFLLVLFILFVVPLHLTAIF